MPAVPFKANAKCRHHIPKPKRRLTNWPAYEASLRQRGDLTVWFSEEAIAAWRAEPRTNRGGQPWYSPLAILTALTLRAVFHLALRQTEGLIGSLIRLLGLDLPVPDHTTLSRRGETLEVPRPRSGSGAEPLHLLVDSTGLKLCGAGEWLHIGLNAETGEIVAAELTTNDVDDASQVGSLLGQVAGPVASFTGDGAYDQDGVYRAVADHQPEAAVIVPPRATAVPSATAASEPTQRDRHLQGIAENGRIGWQKMSGYNKRSRVEAAIGRYKQVIGDGRPSTRGRVRSRKDHRRTTEVGVSVLVLNRMLELGRPDSVRVG
jgi:hypothetical protein